MLRINSGDCQPANVEAELQTKESVETRYWNTIMEINNKVKAAYAYIFWDCSETESKGNLPKQKKKKKKKKIPNFGDFSYWNINWINIVKICICSCSALLKKF